MAESEEELKSLLMQEKEESEKASLKLNIQKITSAPSSVKEMPGQGDVWDSTD